MVAATLHAALQAWDVGLCPIRAAQDGSKSPLGKWKHFQTERPARNLVNAWFAGGHPGLGIVCGATSQHLEMLEVEGRTLDEGVFDQFIAALDTAGLGPLIDRICDGYTETTPGGGLHWLYRCPDGVEGNLKLARRPATPEELAVNPDEKIKVLIETRGEGGFVITAPSNGHTHPSGVGWKLQTGGFGTITTITGDERAQLLAVARQFDQLEPVEPPTFTSSRPQQPPTSDDSRPGDEFDLDCDQVLQRAGFTPHHQDSQGRHYTRPGKDPRHGSSATVWKSSKVDGTERCTLFSSSIDAPPEYLDRSLTPWRLHVALNYGGDFVQAARDWRQDHPRDRPADNFDWAFGPDGKPRTGQPLEDIELVPLDEDAELPPFPLHAFTKWLADHVVAVADSLQVPPDLPASLALGALSTLAAKRTRLRVRGPWVENLNLYLAVAMPPGSGKSPAFRRVIRIIEQLEAEAKREAEPRILEAELKRRTLERRLEQAEKGYAMGSVDEGEVAGFLHEMATTVVPARPKWIIDDVTPEKVAITLDEQGGRIAFLSTEGGVFDQMTGRYSERSNLDVYLQGWSGDYIRVDRVGRSSVDVPEAVITMAVTVQPSIIRQLSERPELAGRGLTARFMYSLPEPLVGHRDFIAQLDRADASVDTAAAYEQQIRAFHERLSGPVGELELDSEAVYLFTEYRQHLEKHRGAHGLLEPLAEWTTKLESSIARLAGILHLAADQPGRTVTATTMQAALEIGRYWLAHAQAVHRMWTDTPSLNHAKFIVAWLREKQKTEPFPLRDVYNDNRRRFPKADATVEPMQLLCDRGWLRTLDGGDVQVAGRGGRGGTRPTQQFVVTPAARHELGI